MNSTAKPYPATNTPHNRIIPDCPAGIKGRDMWRTAMIRDAALVVLHNISCWKPNKRKTHPATCEPAQCIQAAAAR